jgi:TPR repeat protein
MGDSEIYFLKPELIEQYLNYKFGIGVEKDEKKAMECLLQAAKAGDSYAIKLYSNIKRKKSK